MYALYNCVYLSLFTKLQLTIDPVTTYIKISRTKNVNLQQRSIYIFFLNIPTTKQFSSSGKFAFIFI